MHKCNTLRRTENAAAYNNRRLALASRTRRGGRRESTNYTNRRFGLFGRFCI